MDELVNRLKKELSVSKKNLREANANDEKIEERVNMLQNGIDKIPYDTMKTLAESIQSIPNLDYNEKKQMFDIIMGYATLFKLNKENGLHFTIREEHRPIVEKFVNAMVSKERTKKDSNKDKYNREVNDYERVIGAIENGEFISGDDSELITKNIESDDEKFQSLVSILKQNDTVYKNKIGEKTYMASTNAAIGNDDRYERVLAKYNIHLSRSQDEDMMLRSYGKMQNIEEVLSTLKKYGYLEYIDDFYTLLQLLIRSRKDIIERVTQTALSVGITQKDLLKIITALKVQTKRNPNQKKPRGKNRNGNSKYAFFNVGACDDFLANIDFLKNVVKMDVREVYDKCSTVLTSPSEYLRQNLALYKKYGFNFGEVSKNNNSLLALSWLRAPNLQDNADAYFESSNEIVKDKNGKNTYMGIKYIQDNPSRLYASSRIYFYRLYRAYHENATYQLESGKTSPYKYNPKSDTVTMNSLFSGNGHIKDVPLIDFNIDDAVKMTGTKYPPVANETYKRVLSEPTDELESYDISKYPEIIGLNKYISPVDNRVYVFGNIVISRLKVQRIYGRMLSRGIRNSYDALLYAITYNSILSDNEIAYIRETLKTLNYGGKKL